MAVMAIMAIPRIQTLVSDVIVIGGGVAGLQAAVLLSAAGLKVTLLEARNRLGGRVHTLHPPGAELPIELGAEFVHGKPPEIFSLPDAVRLGLREVAGEPWYSDNGRLQPCGGFFEEVDRVMRRISEPRDHDRSFRELVDECCPQDSGAGEHALRYVEGFHAAEPERISVRYLARGEEASAQIHGDAQFWVTRGYDALVQSLEPQLGRAEICLETVVREVRRQPQQVKVQATRAGAPLSFTAPRAVITLPLAVLQAGSVLFQPPLEEKRSALALLEMGPALRITFQFRYRFWDELQNGRLRNLSFLFSRDPDVPTWWTKLESRMLTGWAGGPNGSRLSRCSESEFAERALRSLARILGLEHGRIEPLVETAHTHNWVADPYCLGAYSYALVGGEDAPRLLAAPLAGTLFFAGEATEFTGHNGTVNGAMASGVRAANEILDAISGTRSPA